MADMTDWKYFPLLPFLEGIRQEFSLGVADYERLLCVLQAGDAWTMSRLEHVLCALFARSPEQVERFHRAFRQFFVVSDVAIDPAIVDEWTAALRAEAAEPVTTPPVPVPVRQQRVKVRRSRTGRDFHGRWLYLLLLIPVLSVIVLLSVQQDSPITDIQQPPVVSEPAITTPAPTTTSSPQPTSSPSMRLYNHVPQITAVETTPLPRPPSLWPWLAAAALLLLMASLGFALHLRRLQRAPPDIAPPIDEKAAVFFSRSRIGGSVPARMTPAEMAAMADAMGYFNSDQPDRRLDIDASIHATLRQGGIADCRFLRRQSIRSLLILQDERAEAVAWNSIAAELAAGMAHHGVPVSFGHYRGDPSHFVTAEGESLYLEDLEDQRQGTLLLLFSDGLQFHRLSVQRILEQLAHWPMVAWLDLRLPQFQREGVNLATKLALPRYDATASGILAALGCFLAESGSSRMSRRAAPPLPSRSDVALARWLEMQLGTALLWLADCSKLQPITPALAQKLRQAFHPHLSVEQIELLHRLPGSSQSPAGIQFSHEVRCALGHIWLRRGDEKRHQMVLQFLLDALKEAKPDEPANSIAMLNWEMLHERLLLEMDAEGEHQRMGQLLQSPLAPALVDGLQGYALPAADGSVPEDKIPLASRLKNPQALLRLRGITDNPLNISMLVKRWHRWTLGALTATTLLLGSAALFTALQQPSLTPQLQLAGDNSGMLLRLQAEGDQSATWKAIADARQQPIEAGNYTIALFGGGQTVERSNINVAEAEQLTLTMQSGEAKLPCRSTVADGIELLRCVETDIQKQEAIIRYPLWHERIAPDDTRQLSIGIEVSADPPQGMRDFQATLWRSGSIDAVIHVDRAELAQGEAMTQALKGSGWLPSLPVQLIVWSDVVDQPIVSEAGTTTPIYLASFAEAAAISALLDRNQALAVNEKSLRQRQLALLNPTSIPITTETPAPAVEAKIALTVTTTPADARVRLMNIKEIYKPGMALPAGQYDLEVSADGYASYREWFALYEGGGEVSVALKELPKVGQLTLEMVPASTIATVSNGKASFQLKSGEALPLAAGDWSISAEAKGFQTYQASLQMGSVNLRREIRLESATSPSKLKAGELRSVDGIELAWIPPGEFMMGSPADEEGRYDREQQHRVRIDQGFWMGQTEVTFAQYDRFCEATGRKKPGDQGWGRGDRPVINVSWLDAVAYSEWLSKETGLTFRLPTEAEWEYAARAGTQTPFHTGDCISTNQANYDGNYPYAGCPKGEYRQKTLPVASLAKNDWNLYDMHGNVREWTASLFKSPYDGSELRVSRTQEEGSRSVRGGSWDSDGRYVRAAYRYGSSPSDRYINLGFRVVVVGSLAQDN